MGKKISRYILATLTLLLGLLFVAKFAGTRILTLYIKAGVGDCQKTPILCMTPLTQTITKEINKEFANDLIPYKFPKMTISAPRGFSLFQELIKKVYYKKGKRKNGDAIIYVLYEEPGFFIRLFPQAIKAGVTNNYEFIQQIMFADVEKIKGVNDAFFTIMKGVFIPDLGDQKNVQMIRFIIGNKKGFINYNIDKRGNFFDCNVSDQADGFFKIYIKDKRAVLDLDKVLTIISSADIS